MNNHQCKAFFLTKKKEKKKGMICAYHVFVRWAVRVGFLQAAKFCTGEKKACKTGYARVVLGVIGSFRGSCAVDVSTVV